MDPLHTRQRNIPVGLDIRSFSTFGRVITHGSPSLDFQSNSQLLKRAIENIPCTVNFSVEFFI